MNEEQSAPPETHFDADRPIERREQDRLGRRSFAEAIAKQILAVPAAQGFTMAVVGEWGAGKTSVLNMVAETVAGDDGGPAILRFNPWLFSSADDLVRRFFTELGAQLHQRQHPGLKDVTTALFEFAESAAPLIPMPGAVPAVKLLSKLTNRSTRPPSLLETRSRLSQALAKSGSRIVVLIDDIDRLERREIREVMRLVRLTSDLPNLVFLLAFDRARVASSLNWDKDGDDGQQYLDKIVQVSHDVPVARKATLTDMLIAGLNELIEARDLGDPDREVWVSVLYEMLRPLLGNPRDVKRYLYSLPVTLDAVGHEVALADLLGLEAVRVLRPKVFDDLRAHADYLVHSESRAQLFMTQDEFKRKVRDELTAMLERAAGDRVLLESVLRTLFPVTQEFLSSTSYGPMSDGSWRRQRRVASGEVLRIYLQAALDEVALQSSEVQELVDALTDEDRLSQLLDSFDDQRFEEALERLGDFEYELPSEALPAAVPVLVNRMGGLSERSAAPFELSPRRKAYRVVLFILRRVADKAALAGSLPAVLAKIDSLSGWLEVVELVGHRDRVGPQLVDIADATKLEHQLVERLRSASARELAGEWSLARLSMRALAWLEGQDKDRLAGRLREHLSEDGFVLTLLHTSVGYAYSGSDVRKLLSWDALVEAFGDELPDAVDRLTRSQIYEDASDDDRDTIDLARKYASGERPDEWE